VSGSDEPHSRRPDSQAPLVFCSVSLEPARRALSAAPAPRTL
jgi:hypothetical protein